MTASERLRELHAEGERVSADSGMPGLKYLNSHHDLLPLIADLVEAAEKSVRVGAHGPLGAALTALRDALQPQEGSPAPPEGATAPVYRETFLDKDGNVVYGPEYVIDVPVVGPGANGTYVELEDSWYRLKRKDAS